MAVLPIVRLGDPVLRQPTAEVASIDDALLTLIDDMVETMYDAPGVGLAANQVGVSKRLMVIDLSVGKSSEDLRVCINPRIVHVEGEQEEPEGCLSVPDFQENVVRPERVVMRYLDLDGREQELEGTELMARAMCHECDHLDGKLYIDYLRGLKKERILRKVKKLRKTGDW